MRTQRNKPPILARWIFNRLVDQENQRAVLGDLLEEYIDILEEKGRPAANAWYWIQVSISIPSYFLRKIVWRMDMLKNVVKVLVRQFCKNKLYSFINLIGLAIGIASCFLILVWVNHELNYDQYHEDADRIFRVCGRGKLNDNELNMAYSPAPMARTLKADIPEVDAAVRLFDPREVLLSEGGRRFTEKKFLFAENTVFDVFTFPFVKGQKADALSEPHSMVLTESASSKYFGDDDPLGKTITMGDSVDYVITGVIQDIPLQSHFHFEFLGSLSSLPESNISGWISNMFYTYVRLNENGQIVEIEEKLKAMVAKHIGPFIQRDWGMTMEAFHEAGNHYGYYLQPITDIHLHSQIDFELEANGDQATVTIFTVIAILILVLACINYMNLSTARSATRAREVGVRKVLGANRKMLFKHFMTESIVMTLLSTMVAVTLAYGCLPFFSQLTGKSYTISDTINGTMILILGSVVVLVGIVAGSYPAIYLSSFQPASMLKRSVRQVSGAVDIRRLLVIFQFSISILLLIGTLVVYRQLQFIRNRKLGFEGELIVVLNGGQSLDQQTAAFKSELQRHPGISDITRSNALPGQSVGSSGFTRVGDAVRDMHIVSTYYADADFIKTLDIPLQNGRFFKNENVSDMNNGIVLNETAVARMGLVNPVGKQISETRSNPEMTITYTVLGVVKDFHFESLHRAIGPLAILPSSDAERYISIRLDGKSLLETMNKIKTEWHRFTSGQPFDYSFLDDDVQDLYASEIQTGRIAATFATLAIFIATLGLFGLAAFTAEQRTKEIGIRKVLGATTKGVVMMLSGEFGRWALMGNLIAWPVAYFVCRSWLSGFAYQSQLSPLVFIGAGIVAFLIASITVSYQALRIARANPVDSLKYE